MFYYTNFYRKYGIRRVAQLQSPPLPLLDKLELPRNSIYHYMGDGLLDDGPKSDEFLFRNVNRPILLANVTDIGDSLGNPKRLTIPVEPLIRTFHAQHRRYRKLMDITQAREEIVTVVYSYAFIPRLYRYMRSLYSDYYRWHNTSAAVWKTIGQLTIDSSRNQFIQCKLPKVLPSLPELRAGTNGLNQRVAKMFNTPESMMILEIWKWLGDKRETSLINAIPKENYSKVNLVYTETNRWMVFNLGLLNSWRQATKQELALDPQANIQGFTPEQIQKRFLKLLITLFDTRSNDPAENLGSDENDPEVVTNVATVSTPEGTQTVQEVQQVLTPVEVSRRNDAHGRDEDAATDIEDDFEDDFNIDSELEELEVIAKAAREIQAQNDSVINEFEGVDEDDVVQDDTTNLDAAELDTVDDQTKINVQNETLEQAVMQVCNRYAENGMMSASEYRKFSEISKSYHGIVAPNGSMTLDEFIKIPKETLKIDHGQDIKDIPTVFDKTMLKSSLLTFDEHYIKNVLERDVAGMVMNLQRGGIAITDYTVERMEDILGSYDMYTVRYNPVEGGSGKWTFKLPVIAADGSFESNGTRYFLRKQRGDIPIRKIAPNRVALTSYYGKTFVSRSNKKVNDYAYWIINNLTSIAIDSQNPTVTDFYQTNVFDNTFYTPRMYAILASATREFKLTPKGYPRSVGQQTYLLNLDHRRRVELYGQEAIDLLEKDGSIIIGQSLGNKQFLVLDKNDVFYHASGDTLIVLGTIEEILALDSSKAPTDFVQLKVLGRTIPLAVVFGYEMGLTKLMKLLKVIPRRVPVGTRVYLQPDEYALVFNDETLVFSKDDRFASLILSGFNEYHKPIRQFNVHEFDNRGVYLNVLETNGASQRYLRELTHMYQLFIDPITHDILVEMKEPTNFRGLLLRSCELLLSDNHPDELDSAYMRVKGYERLSGAVYSELTKAIRAHAGRPGKNKLPIDLHPYQIWQTITSDPAKMQIADINPIENLKQKEAMTYSGTGGRGSRSMTKRTRSYHPNDMGVVSESTVDSSDVAINTYTSADPLFTSVRGLSSRYKIGKSGATSLLSTSALISPGADIDDPKRVLTAPSMKIVDCTTSNCGNTLRVL